MGFWKKFWLESEKEPTPGELVLLAAVEGIAEGRLDDLIDYAVHLEIDVIALQEVNKSPDSRVLHNKKSNFRALRRSSLPASPDV